MNEEVMENQEVIVNEQVMENDGGAGDGDDSDAWFRYMLIVMATDYDDGEK